jgi:putative glutamine amidotransferase
MAPRRGGFQPTPRDSIVVSGLKPRDLHCGRLPRDYVTALRRAGGEPVVASTFEMCEDDRPMGGLPVLEGLDPDDASVIEDSSGLVLTGGGDVDPAFFGQETHPRTYNVSPRRDRFEFNLLDEALGRGLPILAICRGMQVLNVHMGGTLDQHLVDRPGRLEHWRDRTRAEPAHDVFAVEGSELASWIGERAPVNSHHHQCLDRVAEPLEAVAYAEDGVLEAVVSRAHSWVVGVQWHPEAMAPVDARQQAIFTVFVRATRGQARLKQSARSA